MLTQNALNEITIADVAHHQLRADYKLAMPTFQTVDDNTGDSVPAQLLDRVRANVPCASSHKNSHA
jgi:hypothetical protein